MHPIQAQALRIGSYYTAGSVEEALELLSRGGARLIAGGSDLLLECERGLRPEIDTLIDITRIEGLDRIDAVGDTIRIGPLVTHNQAVSSQLLVERALPLVQACLEVGSPQLRNRATIAGNLVTASPANDTISALESLDAEVTLQSMRGTRRIRLADFYTGVRRSLLAPDEMLTEISFRALGGHQRGIFVKLGLRRSQAISVVHLSAVVSLEDGVVTEARLLLGSVAPTIVAADTALLIGSRLDDSTVATVAKTVAENLHPIDDIRATASYRTAQVRVMVGRALRTLRDGRERDRWPVWPVTLSAAVASRRGSEFSRHHAPDTPIGATVNGSPVRAPGVSMTLLDWLREGAGLTGTKEGCGEGECGACTVHLNGRAVMACLVPAAAAHGCEIVTIEGLAADGRLHPLQQAFIDQGAVQCGFCIPGFLMAGAKLLEERPHPNVEEAKLGLSGNLCRCTGYYKILAAVDQASGR